MEENVWMNKFAEIVGELTATIDSIEEHGANKELMSELLKTNHDLKKMIR